MKEAVWLLYMVMISAPVSAKERLGVYQSWAAFHEPQTPRCYAIAAPEESLRTPTQPAFLSVGFWPKRNVRQQLYVRLSRNRASNGDVTLSAGGRRFRLQAVGNIAWAVDRRMDLAIVSAIRAAKSLSIEAIGENGKSIVDIYSLRGAPSAIDAAALRCAQIKIKLKSN